MPEAVALAQKNNPSGLYYTCDLDDDAGLEQVSHNLGMYDIVLCIDVIEHVLWPKKMLRLIKKHMAPGSVAFISTLERDISRGATSGLAGSPKREHVREWNQDEFVAFVSHEGFAVNAVKLTPLSAKPSRNEEPMRIQTLFCTI